MGYIIPLLFFAMIGFIVFFVYVIIPLLYIFLYICGNAYLGFLNMNWKNVKRRPVLLFIAIKYFIRQGFRDSLEQPSEIRWGTIIWKPLFKFTKK